VRRLTFAAPDDGVPVALDAAPGSEPVTEHIAAVVAGWPPAPTGRDGLDPAGLIEPAGLVEPAGPGRWQLRSAALETGTALFDNPLAAANAAVGLVIAGLLAPRPDWICLHAAAFDLGSGCILLPGEQRAGKSLFAGLAAACGARLVADDRVLVHLGLRGNGRNRATASVVALGVQPKLRQPLPPALPREPAAFLAAHRGAAEGEMRFLQLPRGGSGGGLLAFGSRLDLAFLAFLDRNPAAAMPACSALGDGAAVARLIPHLYAPGLDAAGRIRAARHLVAVVGGNVLSYADCWDALPLLREGAARPSPISSPRGDGDVDR